MRTKSKREMGEEKGKKVEEVVRERRGVDWVAMTMVGAWSRGEWQELASESEWEER